MPTLLLIERIKASQRKVNSRFVALSEKFLRVPRDGGFSSLSGQSESSTRFLAIIDPPPHILGRATLKANAYVEQSGRSATIQAEKESKEKRQIAA